MGSRLSCRVFGRPLVALRLVAFVALLAPVGACSRCGGDTPETPAASAREDRPDTPEEVSLAIAAHLAPDTPWFVAVRAPAAVLAEYARFRPHLEAVLAGDLGMIETDLRNTLGIDLARASSLEDAGVATDGGFAVTALGDRVIGAVIVADRQRFEERVVATAQARPFNLRADVERRRVGDVSVAVLRQAAGDAPDLVVASRGTLAFLVPDIDGADVDATVGSLFEARDESLATSAQFTASVADAEGYHVHGFASASTYAASHGAEILQAAADIGAARDGSGSVVDRVAATGHLAAGLRLAGGNLEARATVTPTPEALARFVAITGGEDDPGFAPLAVPDVYGFARLTVAARDLYSAVRELAGNQARTDMDAALASIEERVGMDPVGELLPALGSDAIVLLTRARLLTLSRAMNSGSPGEFFSGLGVVIAIEVRDPDTVRRALETIVPGLDGRATLFTEGATTVVEFTDAQADIGNIVLTDRFLLLVPSRQRQEVLQQLADRHSDLSWCDVDAARGLVTAPSANGLFVDVRRVVEGPIGQVAFARLPNEVRRLLGRIDRIHLTVATTERAIVSDIGVRFAAPEDGSN